VAAPAEIRDFDDLAIRLRRLGEGNSIFVAVDGFDGSGKSTLAGRLAAALNARLVEVDSFLIPHQGGYLDNLQYEKLKTSLTDHPGMSIIVEGVCVRKLLSRIGLRAQATIYVKRYTGDLWHDGIVLEESSSAQEALDHEEQTIGHVPQMRRELLQYHFECRPHESSTLVYAWDDQGGSH
jgi:hypothetical protein